MATQWLGLGLGLGTQGLVLLQHQLACYLHGSARFVTFVAHNLGRLHVTINRPSEHRSSFTELCKSHAFNCYGNTSKMYIK